MTGRASGESLSAPPPGEGRLRGRTVVITGAARGIGAALALRLAREGACIAAVGLEPDNLSATTTRCGSHAPSRAWTADVTDHDRMRAVAAEVTGCFGRVDVVVANAGIGLGGLFAGSDPAAFDRVIEVNLLGSVATARAFLPALEGSRGYYLQVASLAAIAPAPLMAAYCASKAGADSFAQALRAEVAHQGVGVGVAYLSWTDTDLVRAADQDELMARFRRRLPWPASATSPLGPGGGAPRGRDRPPGGAHLRPAVGPRAAVAAPRGGTGRGDPERVPGGRPPGPGPDGDRSGPAAAARTGRAGGRPGEGPG